MKNAILMPGRPDKQQYYNPKLPTNSNDHWFPWLSKQLMQEDILTVAVEVPQPYSPRYELWKREFERYDLTPATILVGHSCGGGFLLRYLSEHQDLQVGKVVLVAPWINLDHNPESDTADFFDFELDRSLVSRTKGVSVMVSDDDHESVQQTVAAVRAGVNDVQYHEFSGKGHFTLRSMGTSEFPELLAEALA